jgi:ribosomal protein L25 (general stress protein Ctc)
MNMANELPVLEATNRDKTGKENNKKLRSEGMVPANLLNKGKANSLQVNLREFARAKKNSVDQQILLKTAGGEFRVKITELQVNRLKREPIHVDFQVV